MSGGPPHHPHNRQVPATNTAWNHLQVPNFFPRQPQLAHMSNEHSLLTWHTPTTTEAVKIHPHTHMFNDIMKGSGDTIFPKDCVDLSLARNGNQNGELSSSSATTTPISLSVRDANKINSLPPSALEIQAVELTKCTSPKTATVTAKSLSPGLKSSSPSLKTPCTLSPSLSSPNIKTGSPVSPGLKCDSPSLKTDTPFILKPTSPSLPEVTKTQQKRSNIRVDSILERLNPHPDKLAVQENKSTEDTSTKPTPTVENTQADKPVSVIVQPASSNFDDNSNSNSIPVCTNIRDEDTVSTNSNEDSLDSTKSRRKRKPSKTVRVSKEEEKLAEEKRGLEMKESTEVKLIKGELEKDPVSIVGQMLEECAKAPECAKSDDLDDLIPPKTRRKTSSESETIDNIAAMVQEGLKEKELTKKEVQTDLITKPISVSVIKSKENVQVEVSPATSNSNNTTIPTGIITPAQKKTTNTHFVEVENKLEEMFAGIEDSNDPLKADPLKTDNLDLEDNKLEDPLTKLEEPLPVVASPNRENVTSTTEVRKKTSLVKKNKRKVSTSHMETTPKRKKPLKKIESETKQSKTRGQKVSKLDTSRDIYAYDSGSNASSSKSKGPYIQIRGPRDSPLSVNVVNTPLNDDDGEKKLSKSKKYHDDIEYRHKVRSKGLHSSTLSNKYDAQTKDTTWICAFCKRGPHASELSGPTANSLHPPGDLFGPYFITKDCPEFEKRLNDPFDKQFKSKKISRALDESAQLQLSKMKKSKKKQHQDTELYMDIYLGIVETDRQTFEVWAHEDCIVWSPGIYLIGPKIVGLEEAVWTSCNVECKLCHLKGANICCARRGCVSTMHLCCSRASDWQFVESTYKAYCPQHRVLL